MVIQVRNVATDAVIVHSRIAVPQCHCKTFFLHDMLSKQPRQNKPTYNKVKYYITQYYTPRRLCNLDDTYIEMHLLVQILMCINVVYLY